jgi:hypothetical protein
VLEINESIAVNETNPVNFMLELGSLEGVRGRELDIYNSVRISRCCSLQEPKVVGHLIFLPVYGMSILLRYRILSPSVMWAHY